VLGDKAPKGVTAPSASKEAAPQKDAGAKTVSPRP
jgi:peptidyl-prolyl cis-trans isomerase A (cyclophilin A)